MATYREIQPTEDDSGAPLTSELAKAWTSNVLSIIEGASGAPRIEAGANAGAVAGDQVLFSALGSDREFEKQGSGFIDVPGSRFRATTSGEYRVSFEHRRSGASAITTRVRINGGVALSEETISDTFSQHSVDISLSAGSTIVVETSGDDSDPPTTGIVRRVEYRTTSATRHVGGI